MRPKSRLTRAVRFYPNLILKHIDNNFTPNIFINILLNIDARQLIRMNQCILSPLRSAVSGNVFTSKIYFSVSDFIAI